MCLYTLPSLLDLALSKTSNYHLSIISNNMQTFIRNSGWYNTSNRFSYLEFGTS